MKSLNMKLVLSAVGIVALLASPAFAAQKPHRQPSQQQVTSDAPARSGRGLYDMVPNGWGSRYDPANTGGGSLGYNQNLHDDAW
jgi:opacity protein-like surface antigen